MRIDVTHVDRKSSIIPLSGKSLIVERAMNKFAGPVTSMRRPAPKRNGDDDELTNSRTQVRGDWFADAPIPRSMTLGVPDTPPQVSRIIGSVASHLCERWGEEWYNHKIGFVLADVVRKALAEFCCTRTPRNSEKVIGARDATHGIQGKAPRRRHLNSAPRQ